MGKLSLEKLCGPTEIKRLITYTQRVTKPGPSLLTLFHSVLLSLITSPGFSSQSHPSCFNPISFLPYSTPREIRTGYVCSIHCLKRPPFFSPCLSPCSPPPAFPGFSQPHPSLFSFQTAPASWRPFLLTPLTPQPLPTISEFDRYQKKKKPMLWQRVKAGCDLPPTGMLFKGAASQSSPSKVTREKPAPQSLQSCKLSSS